MIDGSPQENIDEDERLVFLTGKEGRIIPGKPTKIKCIVLLYFI